MLYKELKQVLADKVVEVALIQDHLPVITARPKKRSADEELLDAIFENDVFSKLDNFEVKKLYSVDGGFSLEFDYSNKIAKCLISKNIDRKLHVE